MTNAQAEAAASGKLSWLTRISYGLGDTAQNIVWGAMSIITLFYTDYVGVDPAIIGIIMLGSRIFDGVADVIMGILVERTNSKWGKSRPWILWASIPFALSIVLIYTVPNTHDMLEYVYIFLTYEFCMLTYTALNLPYGSLSAMMTRISKERDMLSITRMALSPIGKILAVSVTLPLIKIFGDDQMAWVEVMSIWAILALALLLLCFFKCKETVVIEARNKEENKVPLKTQLKCLFANYYFWLALSIWMMQNVIFFVTGTVLPYFCKYIFFDDSLYSILYLVETGTMIGFTVLFSPMLLKKFGKRNMSILGVSLALIGHLIYLINPLDFYWVLASCIIRGIGFAPLNSVIFGFLGDVVEYGQWKFHIRQEGLIFSAGSVGTKVGPGITSAVLTGLLSYSGYVASTTGSAVQPQSAIDMIVNLYMFGPIVVWLIILTILFLYKLDKIYPQIMRDLIKREAEGKL